jgi:putative peptide zinc metalloprotease protein
MSDASLSSPLSSAQWHRVADIRPRLADHIEVTRQWVRGQRWHVLLDKRNGQSCRLNASAYEVAARLDGQLSLQALWTLLDTGLTHADGTHANAEPPSQDELLGVIQHLHKHHLLSFDEAPDFGSLVSPVAADAMTHAAPQDQDPSTAETHKPRNTLLAWRQPLLNPDRLLQRCAPLAQALFSRTGLLIWSALMLGLLFGLVLHVQALQAHASKWMQTPRYLLIAALCYPLMKALHEAAHALAVQRWGGHVREAGISLMMLMPVPYVDASAANGFARAWQRALVSAAGIMTELALAAIGLWCWRVSESGLLQDVGFVLWFVGCVSTVLFNANPLQRLDGYHLLTDALHLPNLALRSKQWWQFKVLAWLRGQAPQALVTSAPEAPGERPWLIAYAPLSWLYQLVLWSGMTWWLGNISGMLGWAMGALTIWMGVLAPGGRWLRLIWQAVLWSGAHQGGVRWRAACLLSLPLIVCLPWPDRTVVQGVVWAPEEALVRPQADGVVQTVHAKDGDTVQAGALLVTLHNPRLYAQRERITSQLAQAEQGAFTFMGSDLSKAGQAGDQMQRWQAELHHVDEQIEALQVRAHRAGRLVLTRTEDLPGRYLRRGELLGHVLSDAPPTVRIAVQDQDVTTLRANTRAVSIAGRMLDAGSLPATLLRDSIAATHLLPNAALSTDMGGQIQTDPQDEHHTKTLRPVVLMDVQVAAQSAPQNASTSINKGRLGERVWVRFDQGWSPLPSQAWRWVQRRALVDFNPQH